MVIELTILLIGWSFAAILMSQFSMTLRTNGRLTWTGEAASLVSREMDTIDSRFFALGIFMQSCFARCVEARWLWILRVASAALSMHFNHDH